MLDERQTFRAGQYANVRLLCSSVGHAVYARINMHKMLGNEKILLNYGIASFLSITHSKGVI